MIDFIKAEIAEPKPKSTINSYRSFGYNLSTAIADIIDNSISANANEISIEYKWNGQNSFISIFDNGTGMNKAVKTPMKNVTKKIWDVLGWA